MAVSIYVAAAICGNWYAESGLNPAIWEGVYNTYSWTTIKKGYGFGQWTNVNTSQGRTYQLYTWMTNHGYSMTSGEGQCAFFLHENVWLNNDTSHWSTLNQFLNSDSADLEALVWAFYRNWEGIDNGTYKKRLKYARLILKWLYNNRRGGGYKWSYKEKNYLGSPYETITVSGYGTETFSKLALGNAMMVWKYLTAIVSDGDVPTGEGYAITIQTSGNGTAYADLGDDVPIYSAEAGTYVGLAYHSGGDDEFIGFSVISGGIEIVDYHFTMPANDVIILAEFTGEGGSHEPDQPDLYHRAKSKLIYQIPWWSKYGL